MACMGKMTDEYSVSMGNPVGKIPLRRHRRIEDNIKMNLQLIGWGRTGCVC